MIAKLWHRAMVAIGVRAPSRLQWTPGAAELFAAEMNAAVERAQVFEAQSQTIGTPAYDSAAFVAAGQALIAISRQINGSTDFSVFDQVQSATRDALRLHSQ